MKYARKRLMHAHIAPRPDMRSESKLFVFGNRGFEPGFGEGRRNRRRPCQQNLAELLEGGEQSDQAGDTWSPYRATTDAFPQPGIGASKGFDRQDAYPMKLPFGLWTQDAVKLLIQRLFGIEMPIRAVGEYLKRWGFTPQKPTKRAYD